jgi:hypothetical protein
MGARCPKNAVARNGLSWTVAEFCVTFSRDVAKVDWGIVFSRYAFIGGDKHGRGRKF